MTGMRMLRDCFARFGMVALETMRMKAPGKRTRVLLLIGLAWLVWLCVLLLMTRTAHAQVPQAAGRYKAELLRAAHTQWGLDAPVAALAAQVHQESGWRPGAISRVGALGLSQFMPATARWWCELNGISALACTPTNPTWALRALVGYDKWLLDRSPKYLEDFDRLWLALRSYNGGLGHWQAEARSTGLNKPQRVAIDAACGQARRARLHCAENLGYPRRILLELQPRYASWGLGWSETGPTVYGEEAP